MISSTVMLKSKNNENVTQFRCDKFNDLNCAIFVGKEFGELCRIQFNINY